jgi:ubiquinone/menaquinone biosynthesis C-methylase UbiE
MEKAGKLDAPERLEQQPPERVIDALELSPDSIVLDLGVGTGYFALPIARHLAQAGGNGCVIGLDVELRMLALFDRRARQQGLGRCVEAIAIDEAGPARRLPLADEIADRVLMSSLYHELAHPVPVLEELHRVIRANGMILLLDWDREGTLEKGPPLEHRVAADDVEKVLSSAGFADITRLALYDDFFTIRARRAS